MLRAKKVWIAGIGILACVLFLGIRAAGFFDETKMVHVNAADIESGTLAIGTHLIYLQVISDPLYEIAKKSATESGQNKIYYKSELADGTWFDISTAASLADITTEGTPVENAVINALFFRYHTKSDGQTYDLKTGEVVDIFHLNDPYDLEAMQELQSLKLQYDKLQQAASEEATEQNKQKQLKQFFETDVQDATTSKFDQSLEALQQYAASLPEEETTKKETVTKVSEKVDAARRVVVLEKVAKLLSELNQTFSKATEDLPLDSELLTAIGESISSVQESQISYQGKMLDKGTTVMTEAEYRYANQLIEAAEQKDNKACAQAVEKLIILSHITSGEVEDQIAERNMAKEELLPEAEKKYFTLLQNGESAEYAAALANKETEAILKNKIKENTNQLNVNRNELEFYIDAICLRLENQTAQTFVEQRIQEAQAYYPKIKADDFAEEVTKTLDAHIDWLEQKLEELKKQAGGSDADQLALQKDQLQAEYMAALDENDLEKAKGLQEEIDALADQLKQSDGENSILSNVSNLQGDISGKIGDDALSKSDQEKLEADLDALAALADGNYKTVFPVLEDLRKKMIKQRDLNHNNSYKNAIAKIEKTILDNQDAYQNALRNQLSAEQLEEIARKYFAKGEELLSVTDDSDQPDVTKLSAERQAIVYLLALQKYIEQTQDDIAIQLQIKKAEEQAQQGNIFVFPKLEDTSRSYLPLKAIARYKGMRYIWNANQRQATITKGKESYGFTAFSDQVTITGKEQKEETMQEPAKFKAGIYISGNYTKETFSCDGMTLNHTDYGVIYDETLDGFAESLFALFLKGGEV